MGSKRLHIRLDLLGDRMQARLDHLGSFQAQPKRALNATAKNVSQHSDILELGQIQSGYDEREEKFWDIERSHVCSWPGPTDQLWHGCPRQR
jgi:hypothetical protein